MSAIVTGKRFVVLQLILVVMVIGSVVQVAISSSVENDIVYNDIVKIEKICKGEVITRIFWLGLVVL